MLVYATDEYAPTHHTQWVVWRQLISRFRLFGITDIGAWHGLVARFDPREIRAPGRMGRIPFDQLTEADWELPHPDNLVWIWQAARKYSGIPPQDSSP